MRAYQDAWDASRSYNKMKLVKSWQQFHTQVQTEDRQMWGLGVNVDTKYSYPPRVQNIAQFIGARILRGGRSELQREVPERTSPRDER